MSCHLGCILLRIAAIVVDRDFQTIAGIRAALAAAGSKIQGAIFEENGNQHGMSRALAQARNANRAACMGDFLRIDTPASALQLFTRNDNAWDQGHVFYTPAQAWLAPSGVAQILVSSASGDRVVRSSLADARACPALDVAVLHDSATAMLHVRAVNFGRQLCPLRVQVRGCSGSPARGATVAVRSMHGNNSLFNTPSAPRLVWPQKQATAQAANGSFALALQPSSFTTASLACGVGEGSTRRAPASDSNTCSL